MSATALEASSNAMELFAGNEARAQLPRRLELHPEQVEKGLVQLVMSLVELLRQLLERQALRRVEAGGLAPEAVERLGQTLMRLEEQVQALKRHFGIESLDIDLGPLGRLVEDLPRR